MKKSILFACLAGSISTGLVADEYPDFEAYIGAAQTFMDSDRRLDDATSLEVGAELPLSDMISLEAWFSDFSADIKNSTSELDGNRYSLGGLVHLADGDLRPFLSLGGSHQEFENQANNTADESLAYLGAGVKKYFDNNIILRGEVLAMNSLDNELTDLGARIAVGYAFGRDASKPVMVAEPTPVQKPVVKVEKPVEVKKAPAPEPVVVAAPAPKPVDSDNDGVIDSLDKCPDTNAAFKVDATGCPIMLTESVSIEMNVKFKTNSADVAPESLPEIEKVADFMQQFDQTVVTVEGHTDDRGRAAYNKLLSQKRADAVRMILIDTYKLPVGRVKAVGYGEEQPIADNATAEGRAANRRVVGVIKAKIEKAATK